MERLAKLFTSPDCREVETAVGAREDALSHPMATARAWTAPNPPDDPHAERSKHGEEEEDLQEHAAGTGIEVSDSHPGPYRSPDAGTTP